MVKKFKNPPNGYEVNDGSMFCWLWAFLFGGVYHAVRGNWLWLFLYPIIAISTLGLGFFVLPFFTRKINRTHLLRNGYVECS